MIQKILAVVCFLVVLVSIGCGGGTRGSGGDQLYIGTIQDTSGAPLSNVSVTILPTGTSATTDSNGNFDLSTDPLSGTVDFLLESNSFVTQASSQNIPANAAKIFVKFTVGSGVKPPVSTTTEIRETRPLPTKVPTPTIAATIAVPPTVAPGAGGSPTATPLPTDIISATATPSPTPTKTEKGEDSHGGSGSDTKTPTPTVTATGTRSDDGTVIDAEGKITEITSTLVVVDGKSFVPTSTTEYRGANGHSATLNDFRVGDSVKARGRLSAGVLNLERLERK